MKREDEGFGALHEAWKGRAWRMGEALEEGGDAGALFMGLDEHGGQLLKTDAGTQLRPLHALVAEDRP